VVLKKFFAKLSIFRRQPAKKEDLTSYKIFEDTWFAHGIKLKTLLSEDSMAVYFTVEKSGATSDRLIKIPIEDNLRIGRELKICRRINTHKNLALGYYNPQYGKLVHDEYQIHCYCLWIEMPKLIEKETKDHGLEKVILSLAELLKDPTKFRKNESKLPIAEILAILQDIAAGLGSLHQRNIVHRDIQPYNIWKSKMMRAWQIAGFDMAMELGEDKKILAKPSDTSAYVAPEVMHGSSLISLAADMWGFGLIAFELLTGSLPFDSEVEQFLGITNLEQTLLPAPFDLIIEGCLKQEPGDRLTAPQVLQLLISYGEKDGSDTKSSN